MATKLLKNPKVKPRVSEIETEHIKRLTTAQRCSPPRSNRKAKELLDNGKITARVGELQEGHQRVNELSPEKVSGAKVSGKVSGKGCQ
jgi:hypothetical protein